MTLSRSKLRWPIRPMQYNWVMSFPPPYLLSLCILLQPYRFSCYSSNHQGLCTCSLPCLEGRSSFTQISMWLPFLLQFDLFSILTSLEGSFLATISKKVPHFCQSYTLAMLYLFIFGTWHSFKTIYLYVYSPPHPHPLVDSQLCEGQDFELIRVHIPSS